MLKALGQALLMTSPLRRPSTFSPQELSAISTSQVGDFHMTDQMAQSHGNKNTSSEDERPHIKPEEKFNLLSICGIAVTTGESWIVLGNSLVSYHGQYIPSC
jgi:hypothetical protein